MNPQDTGENLETPSASPAETITTEGPATDNPQGAATTGSPEEVEFNNLKGGTQDRIKQLIHERDAERAKADQLNQFISATANNYQQQPQYPSDPYNPQVREAVQQLSKVGIATKDEVRQEINQSIGNFIYNFELDKLGQELDGSNGLPKFDRDEYRDYITRNPKYQNYDPRDVYTKMYEEEIMDAKLKNSGGKPRTSNSSLRPNKTQVREEQWTPEAINERLSQSDAKQWYSNNKEMINKVMSQPQQ